jgi:hypothetical protein
MVTIQQRDTYFTQQRCRNEQQIKELQERVMEYKEIYDSVPEGYEENNGRLPHFNIPVRDGMYHPTKYIKQLEGGWVTGYSEEDGPNSMPHVVEIFASPTHESINHNDPAKPMPSWFRSLLCRHTATYSTLQKAVINLDNWGLYADITRHHAIDIELGTILGQIEQLHLNAENLHLQKDLCKGCLTVAQAFAQVNHLNSCLRPRGATYRAIPWNKKPRNECGHPS